MTHYRGPRGAGLVEDATVALGDAGGGQGVLVPGGFVLTAAHCITWDGTIAGMALGDHVHVHVRARTACFKLSVWAVEPVADIGVLGEPDDLESCRAFDAWRDKIKPVPISARALPVGKPVRVHVLSHEGRWIEGHATSRSSVGSHDLWTPVSQELSPLDPSVT